MFRLAALGALGYAGYKYFQKNRNGSSRSASGSRPQVAGGPLSDRATLQHNAGAPSRA